MRPLIAVACAITVACFATPRLPAQGALAPGPAGTVLPFRLLRYDEDYSGMVAYPLPEDWWSNLKYVPAGGDTFASFGGEAREQFVQRWNDYFGRVPGYYGSLQQRFMLHGLVQDARWRVFGQLISAWESGKKPAALPIDEAHLDVQQLFADVALDADGKRTSYLRVGRQEIVLGNHVLLKVREGPNVRLAFDGARAHWEEGDYVADAFAATVVEPQKEAFQSVWLDRAIEFSGLNFGWRPKAVPMHADVFYFDYQNRFVRYQKAAGPEHRQTVGARCDGSSGPWDFDYEASYQYGRLGALDVRAWGTALFNSYRWSDAVLAPRATLGLSYVTGDRGARDPNTVGTFNCLFARADYFGDTDLLTGSNTIDVSGALEISPARKTQLRGQWDFLWRSETTDGLYTTPEILIRPSAGSDARYVGQQGTLSLTRVLNRFVTVQIVAAKFFVGAFLKAGRPAFDTESVTWRVQCKF